MIEIKTNRLYDSIKLRQIKCCFLRHPFQLVDESPCPQLVSFRGLYKNMAEELMSNHPLL